MGYTNKNNGVLSGSTCTKPFTISWTKIGREYLIGKRKGRKSGLTVKYFTLGDSDNNYKVNLAPKVGFIPNITGEEGFCINGNLNESIKYNLNVNKEGLAIIKNYNIVFNRTTNNTNTCTINNLLYDIYFNTTSMFTTKPDYFTLLPDSTFNSITDIITYSNSIKGYFKPEYQDIINVGYTFLPVNNSNSSPLKITGIIFTIQGISFSSNITDNSTSICNNLIQSSISYDQQVITNPNIIDTINYSTYILPDCVDIDVINYCKELYGKPLFTLTTVQLMDLANCTFLDLL